MDVVGCPKDSDGDGVLDGTDRCPDTPHGAKVDTSGCPVQAPALFEPDKKVLVLDGVSFESDSAVLVETSRSVLDRVAASLKDWPEVRVEVAGHTDATNTSAHNQKLSEQRAEAVRTYLVDRGIPPAQLTARGYGEGSPIADNATPAGRKVNRRVELRRLD
ncbi:MAG: OmpA family protein [Thermoanaerobaculaceae bacterium]|nr:OmpA family protein [Thermoanaerobaculaceae bacterium]